MCRKRSFSAFPPSKSALYQATGYAGKPAPRTIFIPWMASAARLHPDLWQSFFRGAARSAAPDFAPNPGGKFFGVGKSCHAPRHVLFSASQIGNAAVAQLDRASDYESEGLRFDSSRLHHPADPPDVFVADAAAFSAAPRRRSLRRFARSGCRKVTQPVAAVRAAKHSGEGLCRFPPHCLFVQADCENRIRPDRSTARGRGERGARLLRGRL